MCVCPRVAAARAQSVSTQCHPLDTIHCNVSRCPRLAAARAHEAVSSAQAGECALSHSRSPVCPSRAAETQASHQVARGGGMRSRQMAHTVRAWTWSVALRYLARISHSVSLHVNAPLSSAHRFCLFLFWPLIASRCGRRGPAGKARRRRAWSAARAAPCSSSGRTWTRAAPARCRMRPSCKRCPW